MGMMLRHEDAVTLKCVSKLYASNDTTYKITGSRQGFIIGVIFGSKPKLSIAWLIENYLKR